MLSKVNLERGIEDGEMLRSSGVLGHGDGGRRRLVADDSLVCIMENVRPCSASLLTLVTLFNADLGGFIEDWATWIVSSIKCPEAIGNPGLPKTTKPAALNN
jgi:hypothetical protein